MTMHPRSHSVCLAGDLTASPLRSRFLAKVLEARWEVLHPNLVLREGVEAMRKAERKINIFL